MLAGKDLHEAAESPWLTAHTEHALASKGDVLVLGLLAENERTPPDLLARLLRHPEHAIQHMAAANPSTPFAHVCAYAPGADALNHPTAQPTSCGTLSPAHLRARTLPRPDAGASSQTHP